MVHLSDLSWEQSGDEAIKSFKKGDVVKFKILDVDTDKERISLGIKQLSEDPFAATSARIKKNDIVTCTVAEITPAGIEVSLGDGATGFIRKSDLSRDRSEQRPDRFAVGEKVDAMVMSVDQSTRRITLSIKTKEVREEKEAMAQYGSSDSGASLGDILGAALNKANEKRSATEDEDPANDDDGQDADTEPEEEAEPQPVEEAAAAEASDAPAEAEAEEAGASEEAAAPEESAAPEEAAEPEESAAPEEAVEPEKTGG